MARKLTERQAAFCRHLITGMSAAEAARKAGYSAKTADKLGYQLLENPRVREELERLRATAETDAIMSAREVLERLTAIARGEGTVLRSTPTGLFELPPDWSDRHKALAELAKHHGLLVDKREVTLRKPPSEMSDAELVEALNELAGG